VRSGILCRLEALEKGHRSREERELSSLMGAGFYIWEVVLGYYLGGLKPDEGDSGPFEAQLRALNYESGADYLEALFKVKNDSGTEVMSDRFNDAYRRLFAKVELNFDDTPRNVLFDALVTMINELPDQWLNWLRSRLRQYCPNAEIAVGSNLPRRLSGDNMFLF
jgi:hypothetical protein